MLRKPTVIVTLAVVLTALAGGWLTLSDPAKPARAGIPETATLAGSGVLDGLTFSSALGPVGKPADVTDTLVFDNGLFVSTECERRCNYPARPYFVRQLGNKTEFISETLCPDKNAKIVWRGTVGDGEISGEFTWTVVRWYWRFEKKFQFRGTLSDSAGPLARN